MRINKSAVVTFCSLILFQLLYARSSELSVGKIDLSSLRWGEQTVEFKVTSNTNHIKYLAVEAEVQFAGPLLNPKRRTLTYHMLKPRESIIFSPTVHIPNNYGKAKVTISLYDVVDTLDLLLPTQKFFEKTHSKTFRIPVEMRQYLSEQTLLAPIIESHPDFSDEFARLTVVLLDEGKTVGEIATMAQVDSTFVQKILHKLVAKGHVREKNGLYQVTFPIHTSYPQLPDLSVGPVDFSSLRWGKQTATFMMTNNTDLVKYVTIEADVQFTGAYLNPNRHTRSHYILGPLESQTLTSVVYIPGNFGSLQITISMYDVVDTLDILLPSQKFLKQPFTITFHIPDEMLPYIEERITLPPFVERHPDFDNEFARALLLLLNEGRTVEEIATMAMADTAYVREVVRNMAAKAYVKEKNGSYQVTFPVITVGEAEEVKKLAVQLTDTLAEIIVKNIDHSKKIFDSLVSAGAVDKDSNAFFDGGAVLYRPYPVISALLLWFDMGQKFITRSEPLMIYDGTDLCNAYIPQYMYAVQGGGTFNGTQFYALVLTGPNFQIMYGDVIPTIECTEDYLLKEKLKEGVDWRYAREFLPESFMLDTTIVRPVLQALADGADVLLEDTYSRLRDVAAKHGHQELSYGERYWFWNLVATRTLKKLVDKGIVSRHGNGQFKFDSISF